MAETLKIILLCYWASYVLAFRRRFRSRWANRLAIGAGVLVLLPWLVWLCLEVYDLFNDWPMTIGGKPNLSWYHNHPVWGPVANVVAYTFLALQVLMVPSFIHLVVQMRRISRASPNNS